MQAIAVAMQFERPCITVRIFSLTISSKETLMTRNIIAAVLIAIASALPALAVEAHHEGKAAASPAAGQLSDGEIRKVDKDAKKITIRHGPIPSLNMPAMTMVFQVKEPAMLEQVKPGDKVKFEAQKLGGAFTVTKIEAAK